MKIWIGIVIVLVVILAIIIAVAVLKKKKQPKSTLSKEDQKLQDEWINNIKNIFVSGDQEMITKLENVFS